MGVVTFKSKLSGLKSDANFRFDVKYGNFIVLDSSKLWNSSNCYELKNVLKPLTSPIVKKGELEGEQYLIDLSNIERKRNNLINLEVVTEIGSDKSVIKFGDLVIPKIEPKKGQFFLNLNHNEYIGSTELNEYEINKDEYNPFFLYYLLTTDKFLKVLSYLESGKTHKRVSAENLLKIKVPKIAIEIQNDLAKSIQPIETEITNLKNSKLKPLDIINKVFGEEFGFDWEICDKYINNKFHKAKFTEIANDEFKFDISLKYRKAFEIAKNNSNINWVTLNELVIVKGGKRLQKGEVVLEEETDYKYIRVDDLSREGNFDLDNIKFINEKNHLSIKNYIAEKDDILLTIVGATIGKCGIVPEELDKENITENFARLIIKDKVKFNPVFILYSLMSRISQFQFSEYSGKSSQGKLALFRIKKTIIPNVNYLEQAQIVEKIKSQIDAQNIIDNQIEQKQQQINAIIENAIKTE